MFGTFILGLGLCPPSFWRASQSEYECVMEPLLYLSDQAVVWVKISVNNAHGV